MFELYNLEPPYDDHAGPSVKHRQVGEECPADLRHCILGCLQSDPNKRRSAYDILILARRKLEEKPEHFAAVREHRLLSSCEQGDFETVRQLLEDNTAVDARDGTDWETPLHRAARAMDFGLETARLLLDKGADIKAKSKNGETPLHVAAETGQVDVVKLLLGIKACTMEKDKRDWLPLHTAASQGHDAVVKILIEKGADKDAFTSDSLKRTPLHIAAANGHYKTVLSLIEIKADVNVVRGDGSTALRSAAESGCVSILAELLAAGAKLNIVNKDGKTILLVAAAEGHAEAVRYLLCAERERIGKAGWAVPSFRIRPRYGLSPVHAAALGNHATVLQILLEDGFAVDAPVEVKVVHNLVIEVQMGWTALHIASTLGHREVITALLEFQADKEQRTKSLETALHLAAACGHIEAARCLIQAGTDLEARAFKRFTPLHYAAARKQDDMVNCLLDKGADVHTKASSGATALHLAANAGHAETVTVLMSGRAPADAVNKVGQTALHVAKSGDRPQTHAVKH